ncbi:LytR/AlgR family response regulator transcription factor [Marivirga arenosa]|uniref:LytTR family DNA-binding domain-containing protein n=1 Tax=Marivirga arenosa TaxID=3059076 RepID=A0AA49GF95_9BACT|nr:LytTR family DNA-binding domain-containing protein [Marivirga sp. BKB1-2]WKK79135.2 LytTR family DNA-binding domain-containing protein [Marivirga sp. BKB1-2]
MNILVIEDERPAATRIIKLLNDLIPEASIHGHFDTIVDSVEWLSSNPAPDLIISDIELADGQSFEIYNQVKTSSPIIFTTAYDQFAIKAFKLNSIDYLLKPIDPEELGQAIEKYKNNTNKPATVDLNMLQSLLQKESKQYKDRFMVKVGEKIYSINSQDISFIYSEQKATFLQTQGGKKYIVDYTLDQLDSDLNPDQFFRLNRKYITSLEAIDEIITYSNSRLKIKLKNCEDNDIIVSREKVNALKSWLDQ